MYAIIRTGGKQYKVQAGDVLHMTASLVGVLEGYVSYVEKD